MKNHSDDEKIYINLENKGGDDLTEWLDSLDNQTGSPRGRIKLLETGDPTTWMVLNVTGATTTASGYKKLNVDHVTHHTDSDYIFGDGAEVAFNFTYSGSGGGGGRSRLPAAQRSGLGRGSVARAVERSRLLVDPIGEYVA